MTAGLGEFKSYNGGYALYADNASFDGGSTFLDTDGQIWIGKTGGAPLPALITSSNGVQATFGANSIDLSFSSANSDLAYVAINNASSPYTVLVTDHYIGIDTSGGAVTVLLPNTTTTGNNFIIKDFSGNAGANNITITTPGGTTLFDGAATRVINANFGSVQVLYGSSVYQIF